MLSVLIFFLITLVYFISKYYITNPSTLRLAAGVLFGVAFLQQVFSNNNAIIKLCGSQNLGSAFYITAIPWIFIFGTLYACLTMFPSWKVPFSNTFGYIVVKIAGLKGILNQIYDFDKLKNNKKKSGLTDSEYEALNNLYKNPAPIINQIPEPMYDDKGNDIGFNAFIRRMQPFERPPTYKEGNPSSKDKKGGAPDIISLTDLQKKLQKLVKLKFIVSEFIWYFLTGVYITMISANSVINNGCNVSVPDMQKRNKEYNKKVAEEEAKPKPKKQVYYVRD